MKLAFSNMLAMLVTKQCRPYIDMLGHATRIFYKITACWPASLFTSLMCFVSVTGHFEMFPDLHNILTAM